MQKCILFVMPGLLAFATQPLQADTLALEIGSNNLNLAYQRALTNDDAGRLYLDSSLLYTKQHDHQDLLAGIGLLVMNTKPQRSINFAAGIKGFITDVLDYRVGAITLGGMIKYKASTQSPVEAHASVYYAPKETSTMDGDYFQLVDIALEYQLGLDAGLRLGYRDINIGINHAADAELDQGAYLGWLVNF